MSFVAMVLLPVALSGGYLWTRAVDQYASYVGFSVRTEEVGSAIELLGGVTELSGSSSSDTDILYKFLQSQELVANIDAELDLREIWSKADPAVDPVFAYEPPGTIEDLVEHWERKVAIYYDSGSGLLDLRILAFAPEDAQAISTAIFEKSSAMINQLSTLAREDAIGYARDELDQAVIRLREARVALNAFRNRTQIVDPTIDTQSQMGLLTNLEAQLADALIEVDLLRETTRPGDPRITQGELRVEVIERRIAEERRQMGLGGGSSDERSVFADLVGEYETLAVDLEFAQQSYVAALAAFDAARNEARRQSRYLAAHVRPTLAEQSKYPERGFLLGLIALFSFLAWSITALIAYSLRDRR
ncbi:capsule biosynthesis protein [Dinoroseobacter sp. S76]|uniref:capsule biosynthesis protein n=1 Tax=Dinoroseobacter sp. S76 TaxID=3415124 RepID=UPI003C7CE0AB